MLACNNCGHVFDEDEAIYEKEYTGVSSEQWQEVVDVAKCPRCGDDYVENAHRCEFCGEWSADYICPECKKIITVFLKRLIEHGMSLHRSNKVVPNRLDVINAICEVLETID